MTSLIRWLGRHRLLTLGGIVVFVGLLAIVRVILQRSQLSNVVGKVTRGAALESVYGIGTVTATRSYAMRLGVIGTITKLYVREGDLVKKGQRLVDVDGTGNRVAPFDGTVTFLPVKEGETVFSQGLILNLVDLSDRYVVVSLEQRAAVRVRNGQKVRLSFDNLRNETHEGVVESLYSNDSSFLVRVGVTGLPAQILPGMTADVAIAVGEHKNVLLLPISAIDDDHVYVRRGLTGLETVAVQTGVVDGSMAEVVSGNLEEGDVLVVKKGK